MRDSSLEGRIRAPGPDHAGTLQSSAGLEATLVNLGRLVEAERLRPQQAPERWRRSENGTWIP